ncbi:Isc1 phospholipase C [Scheffersomyces coipomensis]|uniref:Isc1 phospholipase C n=1 Tax=Scheffersomyces coipomensis TaxID=1788519 RepID=UPI00315D08F6
MPLKESASIVEDIDATPVATIGTESTTTIASENDSIKLLTFNTWGLKFISKHRRQRIEAIAQKLCEEQYDIVALQEIWSEDDWKYFNQTCQTIYPYRRAFKSGIIAGPGLAILSKIPIDQSFLYRFPINGRPSAFFRGDWYVGKGISITTLKPHKKNALPIAILNSHMHAPYSKVGDASYSTHRACQAWDFTKIVNMLKRSGFAVIQVGDLNSRPNSLPYNLFTVESQLIDSWRFLNPNEVSIAGLTPEDQIITAGVTCNSQLNTYRTHSKIEDACRLDYALIDINTITPLKAAVKFTEKLPAPLNCSYSDHFGYSIEFAVQSKDEHKTHDDRFISDPSEKIEIYQQLLIEIAEYRKHTIPFQSNWRKIYFFSSILITLSFYLFSGFQSRFAVLFLFLSHFILVTGILNGMIWFFGVRSESRALQEVELEVEDAYFSLKTEMSHPST